MVKAKKKAKKPKKVAKKVVKKVVKKVGTKKPAVSATEKVLKIIKMYKRGVGTVKIKQMTQFNQKKIWDAIYRLKKRGKVKSAEKGCYVAI
jgi:hypothetical protein